ncbi:hypothetical protein E4T48_07174 [Aureobasidium sp. EXF-10727]|nr:hypothetical protein E4T48_07174 [Aureobasidium sp. EXF-10727]
MVPRYVPPHIRRRRTTNTTHAAMYPQPPRSSYLHTSLDTRGGTESNHDTHNHSSHQPRETPTAPRAMMIPSMGFYNHRTDPMPTREANSWHALRPERPWLGRDPRSFSHFGPCNAACAVRQPPHGYSWPAGNISDLLSFSDLAARFGLRRGTTIHTLNASADSLYTLKFIVLFDNVDLDWHRHQTVYAKANLHLLPGYELPYPDQGVELSEDYHDHWSDCHSDSDLIDLRSRAGSAGSLRVEMSSASSANPAPSSSTQSDRVTSPYEVAQTSEVPPIALFSHERPRHQPWGLKLLGWYEIEETEFFAPETCALANMLEGYPRG